MTDLHETDVIEEFVDAMFDKGIKVDPTKIIADGKLHRIHVDGDGPKELNGFYVLHFDEKPAGLFGCNRRYGYDQKFSWTSSAKRQPMTADERRAYREKMEAKRKQQEAELAAQHKRAADLANSMWNEAVPCQDDAHPYLARKRVKAHGLRIGTWRKFDSSTGAMQKVSDNALLVPIRDAAKNVLSLQAILPDANNAIGRDKDYLSGGDKHGRFYAIGKPQLRDGKAVIIIGEGYATCASIHEATGHAVIVAFDAPNIAPVAAVIRERFPEAIIVIASDHDQWTLKPIENPGLTRAREAAAAVGGLVAIPPFSADLGKPDAQGKLRGPTDFNDLALLEGADAVREAIEKALIGAVVADDVVEQQDMSPWDVASTQKVIEQARSAASVAMEDVAEERATNLAQDDDVSFARPDNEHFKLLGYNREAFFAFDKARGQIKSFTSREAGSMPGLIDLAPLNWWQMYFRKGKENAVDKEAALNFLVGRCKSLGIYDNGRTRGRGAWVDRDRVVFHHGDVLSVDGVKAEVSKIDSRYVYELDIALPRPADEPLSDQDGARLFEIAKSFRWTMPGSAALLAGFVMLAPLCGALRWRPHVWLTGGAGCGKSTVLNEFVHPLMNGYDLFAQGNSSEAGIRQTLKADARPVLFDESESNEEGDIRRIQNVLSLIRQASTESEAQTFKGTAGGTSMSFHIRSMFCLASIQVAIKHQADVERLTVLSLRPKREDANAADSWKALKEKLYTIKRDPTIAARLMRRALLLLPVIQKNIEVFTEVAARKFGSQRDGDQYGTLLAGAWALITDEPAQVQHAEELIDSFDWDERFDEEDPTQVENATLTTFFGSPVKVPGMNVTLYDLVRVVLDEVDGDTPLHVSKPEARMVLAQHGVNAHTDIGWIYIGTGTAFPMRNELLRGTPIASGFDGLLAQIPGHIVPKEKDPKSGREKRVKKSFGNQNSRHCIGFPVKMIITD